MTGTPERSEPAAVVHRRAALFVDFENVYIGLGKSSPEAAQRFATDPARWVHWMEQELGPLLADLDAQPRTVLRRICYLDPARSSKFRAYFTRAGFRIVDCPALTAAGKNSADIHMVLDILDTLVHPTWFDEFIVLSADADFTPVLLRLREHDRRTAMLVSGPTAAALRAACDFAIPDSMFLDEALGLGIPDDAIADVELPGADVVAAVQYDELREQIRQAVQSLVADSSTPVAMARAAHDVRQTIGPALDSTNWVGARSFGRLVATFVGKQLRVAASPPPGWLFDPTRHEPPGVERPTSAGIPEVAERLSRVVGVPLLPPEAYAALFETLVTDARPVAADGQAAAERAVREACAARGQPVPRSAIHFVLLGFRYSGIDWLDPEFNPKILAGAFADNTLRLAAREQMQLTDDEQSDARQWITGSLSQRRSKGGEVNTRSVSSPVT